MSDISKTSNNQAEEKLLAEFDYDQDHLFYYLDRRLVGFSFIRYKGRLFIN